MRTIGAVVLCLAAAGAWGAEKVVVQGARLWAAPDHTRVVFDVSGPVEHALFTLSDPERVVIDLAGTELKRALGRLDLGKGHVKGVRHAPRNASDLRVVLDLRGAVKPKSFVLRPNSKYGHRLVVDLYDKGRNATSPVKTLDEPSGGRARELIVAIDPGHGGEDPGATGRHGTREKDVVLAIARRLEALVRKEPGMRPVMIRDGDYYVGLRKRVAIARQAHADVFVSIHADAFRTAAARGASVYALSQRGASSEAARWLADQENNADFIGGVSLEDKDELLTQVLLDLSLSGTIEASMDLGHHVLGELKRLGRVHKRRVHQAGFVVLKSPDVPSVLVETAFISNPHEERKLRDARHQRRVARAILRGVRHYLSRNPPPGTLLAQQRRHIIERGDTLSGIAARYDVSLRRLRASNGIKGDLLRVGDVLKIPPSAGS